MGFGFCISDISNDANNGTWSCVSEVRVLETRLRVMCVVGVSGLGQGTSTRHIMQVESFGERGAIVCAPVKCIYTQDMPPKRAGGLKSQPSQVP